MTAEVIRNKPDLHGKQRKKAIEKIGSLASHLLNGDVYMTSDVTISLGKF